MKCLVTGVAGFVGSTLAESLLAAGHTVTGIDCFTDYYPRVLKEDNLSSLRTNARFSFIEADILRSDAKKLLDGVEWVFHQAAQAGVRKSWGPYFSTYVDNNISVTQCLLEAAKTARTLKKFVYASSSSVYGNAERMPTSELVTPHPVSPYGVTKLAAEHLCTLYASQFNVPTVSLRYFTVYGPRQRPDMGFYRFILACLRKESLTLFGDGTQTRDFTYIDDIVAANIAAAEKGITGGVYNIGGGTQASINDLLEIIKREAGYMSVSKADKQPGDAAHTGADTALARQALGYAPKISLPEGIAREVRWLKANLAKGLVASV